MSLAGRCDLSTFAEVVDRANAMISVDSASMHMAVAMRTPVVSLFGPTDSRRWGPYPNGCPNQVVEAAGDCSFCKREKGCLEHSCMKMIEVREVVDATSRLLQATTAQVPAATLRQASA